MGYISGYYCDRCGKYGALWTVSKMGIVFAQKSARENGWQIGKMGWLCPECKREVTKERRETRKE